jgi:DNA invertase Pin-like site-specific DNA recombinase
MDTRTIPTPRRAFSYARFSSAKQADGASLARQIEATRRYCERNGLTLDERSYQDLGVSAFTGSNSRGGDLAQFIELAKDGRIPKNSVLVVENTDRLSRLPPDEATAIIMSIVSAGVDVATLAPEQLYTKKTIHSVGVWVPLQVAVVLAHEESLKKSARLSDAWSRKRAALAGGKKLSGKCPYWLKPTKDRMGWVVLEDRAELVRLIFHWCVEGLGCTAITERLHRERPDGFTGRGWQASNVRKLLRSPSVLGHFQPMTGTTAKKGGIKSTRQPAGPVIPNYYPPIVSEPVYYRVQQMLDGRRRGGGRATGTPNLFSGLLTDAVTGRRVVLYGVRGFPYLVESGAVRKKPGAKFTLFPYRVAERAVLELVKELKVKDVTGKAAPSGDETETWSGKLTATNSKIESLKKKAASADDPSVYFDLIDDLTAERTQVIAELEAAKARAASPVGDVLGECQSLAGLLDRAEPGEELDERRRRTKAAIGRLVERMVMLVVPGPGKTRSCAMQLHFREGGSRSIVVVYRAPVTTPTVKAEAKWKAVSVASRQMPREARMFDLRDKAHVKAMRKWLAEFDVAAALDDDDEPAPGEGRAKS